MNIEVAGIGLRPLLALSGGFFCSPQVGWYREYNSSLHVYEGAFFVCFKKAYVKRCVKLCFCMKAIVNKSL
ncbi:hypothetical protein BAOM_4130 [Peribacillus asahii]|uniref:Uncharacterized protein n=1 Tax=Peribacillus asahii TaxID=228899 RepID=A0A3T0KWN3_9BACI|nr:hypothetical protein BAOM_4130 [Peribacillus asahii]